MVDELSNEVLRDGNATSNPISFRLACDDVFSGQVCLERNNFFALRAFVGS